MPGKVKKKQSMEEEGEQVFILVRFVTLFSLLGTV
jgi:hypothetical protein